MCLSNIRPTTSHPVCILPEEINEFKWRRIKSFLIVCTAAFFGRPPAFAGIECLQWSSHLFLNVLLEPSSFSLLSHPFFCTFTHTLTWSDFPLGPDR